VLTELVGDVAHLLLPSSGAEIRRALLGLRCAPLLTGYRGAPPADLDRAVAVIGRVAELVLSRPEVVSLEINPLIVTADGAWVCDALAVT
jgi:ATP-grasp domain-containing protein